MAAFIVDTKPDLEFVGTQMSVGYRSARNLCLVRSFAWPVYGEGRIAYMAMFQPHSDRAEARRNVLGNGINLVEGASAGGECTCKLVHEADASKTSIKG